jgi:hypothetical protein
MASRNSDIKDISFTSPFQYTEALTYSVCGAFTIEEGLQVIKRDFKYFNIPVMEILAE